MSELRAMIRELLHEEVGALRAEMRQPGTCREDHVAIRSSHDVNAFALRLLDLATDPEVAAAIRSGHHRFVLDTPTHDTARHVTPIGTDPVLAPPLSSLPATCAGRPCFDRGLVTERDIAALPAGTGAITLKKTVRLTPLARDEARRLNIKIERLTS